MKWIQIVGNVMTRGHSDPPAGELFFVDSAGARHYKDGKLFEDGSPAKSGKHVITFDDGGTLEFDVDTSGNASRGQYARGSKV